MSPDTQSRLLIALGILIFAASVLMGLNAAHKLELF